jgi:tRNA (cmo5U34)-methyltransferase
MRVFLNADQLLGPTPANENEYQKNWMNKIEVGSLSEFKKNIYDRIQLDNPAKLEDNIKWLKNSDFNNVDVYYKYYNFVVLYRKNMTILIIRGMFYEFRSENQDHSFR